MSKTISARIDDTLHTMITDEANQKGKTVNESLKEMLNNHFNGEQKEEGNLSQIAENSEMVLQLDKKQNNQDKNLKEIFKILDRISDRISENDIKLLEAVDQRLKNHEHAYKHEKEFHSSLRCNSS